jgi:hypothetical protein
MADSLFGIGLDGFLCEIALLRVENLPAVPPNISQDEK